MKLTVLSENAVLYPGLEGEFGLSVYLEEGDTRLLFDAGERDACLRNAEKLGIDLRRVTAVAFSHNHRDHCGGFLRLAEQLPPDVPIYAHSGFFIRKWWDHRCDPPQQETYSQTLELVGPPMEASWFFQQGLTGFRCLADDCLRMCIFWETFRPPDRKRRSIPPRSWRGRTAALSWIPSRRSRSVW